MSKFSFRISKKSKNLIFKPFYVKKSSQFLTIGETMAGGEYLRLVNVQSALRTNSEQKSKI